MKKELEKRLSDFDINVDIDDFDWWDELADYIYDNGLLGIEIIYYHNAIKYLSENDPSLVDSLELASDMGYEIENINSEILASLHASDKNEDKFSDASDELEAMFNKIKGV